MWRRRNKYPRLDPADLSRARQADARAANELAQVRAQRGEVERVSDALARTLERNHFGESIELAFKRRRTAT